MELIWFVLTLLAVDLAALVFAADTRPGFEHSSRWRDRRRAAPVPTAPGRTTPGPTAPGRSGG
jgi:hypothetical protein